jgi:hypothetical protein
VILVEFQGALQCEVHFNPMVGGVLGENELQRFFNVMQDQYVLIVN